MPIKKNCFKTSQTIIGVLAGVLGICVPLLYLFEFVAKMYRMDKTDGSQYDIFHIDKFSDLGANIVYLVVSILLIIGIIKKSHLLLVPWMVVNVILAIIWLPVLFYVISYRAMIKSPILFVLSAAIGIALLSSLWFAVFFLFLFFLDDRAERNRLEIDNQKKFISSAPYHEVAQSNV